MPLLLLILQAATQDCLCAPTAALPGARAWAAASDSPGDARCRAACHWRPEFGKWPAIAADARLPACTKLSPNRRRPLAHNPARGRRKTPADANATLDIPRVCRRPAAEGDGPPCRFHGTTLPAVVGCMAGRAGMASTPRPRPRKIPVEYLPKEDRIRQRGESRDEMAEGDRDR